MRSRIRAPVWSIAPTSPASTAARGVDPNTDTVPPSGSSSPSSMSIVVDLPAPFGPRSATVSPRPIAKSIPRTARTSPNDFASPLSSIPASAPTSALCHLPGTRSVGLAARERSGKPAMSLLGRVAAGRQTRRLAPSLGWNGASSDRDRAPARRPERRPARGRDDDGGAAARRRRRGLRKDARAHESGRLPAHPGRPSERDPRDHVHEQGRRRDALADRGGRRHAGAGDLDHDLPRRLRPHPAPRGRAARLPLELHDLRPVRPDPARPLVPRGARARPQALHAARDPFADLEREEPADLPRRVRRARRELLRPDRRRRLRPLPAQAVLAERGRLRRHADADGRGAPALPRGAGALGEGVPLRPRRRVPGHEPRAVRRCCSCSQVFIKT